MLAGPITMSLDGFVATPGIGPDTLLGIGGERRHDWLFQGAQDPDGADRFVADEFFTLSGAFLLGRRTFDVGERPWGKNGAFGRPCFVLTHRTRPELDRRRRLVDELHIHIATVRLGAGTQLFAVSSGAVTPLKRTRVMESPFATHLRFTVHTEDHR